MTVSIDVWPRLGTTVTLDSGYVVTASGAEALATDEILDLLRRQRLLTYDPTFLNPNPSPIPPVPGGGGGASAATIAALGLLPGVTSGLTCYCQGFRALGDGGEGEFYWEQGSTTTPDGGTCIAAAGGRWKRNLPAVYYRNVKWFGAYGDDSHNDTAAIQAAIDSCGSFGFGAEVFLPNGTYKITETLRWEGGTVGQPLANGRLRGENAGSKTFAGAVLKWYGPSTHPTFSTPADSFAPYTNGSVFCQFNAMDSIVENIAFKVALGYHCGTMVNLGYDQTGTPIQALNQMQFINCGFAAGRPEYNTGSADYCVTWDYWNVVADQNTEDCSFEHCAFGGARNAAFWFRSQTQPFGTSVRNCFMNNSLMVDPTTPGWTGSEPYGSCFKNDTLSLSLTVQDCDMQRFATFFYLSVHPQQVKVINCHGEATKRLWYSNTGAYHDLCVVSFDGGRYTPDGFGAQSYGPGGAFDTSWAPAEDRVFLFRGDHPVTISNCNFQSIYAEEPFKIHGNGNDITSIGNRFPNPYPFSMGRPFEATHIARTFSQGDTVSVGASIAALPTLRGCLNPGGQVTISGASASANVAFAVQEWFEDAFGNPISQSYKVSMSVHTITGTPVVTTPYISAYASTGFTINLPTAPGLGNSITISYELYRV